MICLHCRGEKAKGQIILVLMVVQFCGRITVFPHYTEVTAQLHPYYAIYNHIELEMLYFWFRNEQNK